ncbi:MAG: ABC transporter transmembrane domain-containing protein, partial [Nitrospirota bacterium]|nr:ABC transporter transmembrane domain-containing protein [Nitrospirota bacterium]
MVEKDNFTRNTKADEWRINFYRQKPTLRRVFSSGEYQTLWMFLKPKWPLLLLLAGISFALAFLEGGKALLLVGMIKGLVSPETGIKGLLTFSFMGKTFSPGIFGTGMDRIGLLVLMVTGFLTLTFMTAGAKMANMWLGKRLQVDLMREVRNKVMDKIFSFDLRYFDEARSGELIFLMNSETSRFSNLVMFAINFLTGLVQASIFIILLMSMSWDITLLII